MRKKNFKNIIFISGHIYSSFLLSLFCYFRISLKFYHKIFYLLLPYDSLFINIITYFITYNVIKIITSNIRKRKLEGLEWQNSVSSGRKQQTDGPG